MPVLRLAPSVSLRILSLLLVAGLWPAAAVDFSKFKRIEPQYIAALADAQARSGSGAQTWGLWTLDPGPRGYELDRFAQLKAAGGVTPAQWKFDAADWWLEEHGLIMEKPAFPLPAGKYLVTGGRKVTTVLTVHPTGKDGKQRWELAEGATLYDVTHLGCRAGRYTPAKAGGSCSPASVQAGGFPVTPGAAMPDVSGCRKQEYLVLIVVGLPVGE